MSASRLGIAFGYMRGMTLYHISFYDAAGSGGESELEFPLNTFLFGIEGSYHGGKTDDGNSLRIDYRLITNLGGGTGAMKDSDWLTSDQDILLVGAAHPGLDIYSESDAELMAWIVDLRMSYDAWADEQWSMGPLAGILYEKFSYDVRNVNQVGYGPYAPNWTGSVTGKVLSYDVSYVVPFVGLRASLWTSEQFEAQIDLGYSPAVSAEDKDDHILRHKLSKGITNGSARIVSLYGQWDLPVGDRIHVRGQYLKIHTTGSQTQRWYADETTPTGTIPAGTTITGINDRIDSQQSSLLFVYQHPF